MNGTSGSGDCKGSCRWRGSPPADSAEHQTPAGTIIPLRASAPAGKPASWCHRAGGPGMRLAHIPAQPSGNRPAPGSPHMSALDALRYKAGRDGRPSMMRKAFRPSPPEAVGCPMQVARFLRVLLQSLRTLHGSADLLLVTSQGPSQAVLAPAAFQDLRGIRVHGGYGPLEPGGNAGARLKG